ncbi:MAG TPA: peptidylprolyl isomerase [Chthoniobacteraceae bacterium]|nr:peptidylprolyl isomerase [Chthoniobacteraceae bacterium]
MKLNLFLAVGCAIALCVGSDAFAAEPARKTASPGAKKSAANSSQKPAAPSTKAPLAAEPAAAKAPATVEQLPETVAVVEGVPIKRTELDETLNALLAQNGRSAAELPAEQKSGAYRMILDDMIADRLITKRAAVVQIPDEAVETTFKRATANIGSDEEIKAQIEKSGQTVAKVKANIRASLQQQQWIEEQIKDKAEVSDADAEGFFKKNPEQFKVPERVRASHILISVPQDAAPDAVTKKLKQSEGILARVKKGEDFNKLAAEVSEDPTAKENGGDLDFFARDQMVPEFSEAAFKLKKDEVSEPVRSQYGYHIIKLTDRKEAGALSLEEAKPRLLAFLKQQKKQAELQKLVQELRAKADVKVNLPPAAPATAPQSAPAAGETPSAAPEASAAAPAPGGKAK